MTSTYYNVPTVPLCTLPLAITLIWTCESCDLAILRSELLKANINTCTLNSTVTHPHLLPPRGGACHARRWKSSSWKIHRRRRSKKIIVVVVVDVSSRCAAAASSPLWVVISSFARVTSWALSLQYSA